MKRIFESYFTSWWLPPLVYLGILAAFSGVALSSWRPLVVAANCLTGMMGIALLGLFAVSIRHFIKRQWSKGFLSLLLIVGCGVATVMAAGILAFSTMFGPSEDGFADSLKIPEGIVIAEPERDASEDGEATAMGGTDELQDAVRKALTVPGNDKAELTPDMPSLRKAATNHASKFMDYVEASPDWHVFLERGNRFASRSWSYGGEPRDELHGYISEFNDEARFQTRCLLCLDRKQWSSYSVQHVEEGKKSILPEMRKGNELHESRIMVECGGVWVELFEQSNNLERRVTKATLAALEKEFSEFLVNPDAAVAKVRGRSRELAKRLAGTSAHDFRLLNGMQPGIYTVAYSLNPGEAGSVYLKAFEVTQGTPLSAARLEEKSKTRMTWSSTPEERFGAKAGFTIYEGDWGKPYAARFEVWFEPDSGKDQRKLAERVFKIEGWQR
ncbi:MAG: hypothetical protein JNN17_11710 [Verrucomicrobiaceae bacterium]|nr:hypothetical protein [Verrucomicrobiaceae bacterium]